MSGTKKQNKYIIMNGENGLQYGKFTGRFRMNHHGNRSGCDMVTIEAETDGWLKKDEKAWVEISIKK